MTNRIANRQLKILEKVEQLEKEKCEICEEEFGEFGVYELDDKYVCQSCYSNAVSMDSDREDVDTQYEEQKLLLEV